MRRPFVLLALLPLLALLAAPARAAGVLVVAVGDIACAPGYPVTADQCQHAATARLTAALGPAALALLGDTQYNEGTTAQYAAGYDPTWGRFNPVANPVPGNHEYRTAGAAGYRAYFGARAVRGGHTYYAWTAGSWRFYALDSNTAVEEQTAWLTTDLAAHPARCVAAYWHHSRFSDGDHQDLPQTDAWYRALYAAHADVVLSGHDHIYQRFTRLDPARRYSPAAPVNYVVGTGGRSTDTLTRRTPALVRAYTGFGALALTLRDGGWSWRYVSIDGVVRDSGSRSCV